MNRTTTRRRLIGYVRVSTSMQADAGHSLEAQRAKLDAWCALYDADLVDVVIDAGLSASTMDGRPGLVSLLSRLRAGEADGVLVAKLDRLTRSTRDLGELVDRSTRDGWAILSVAEQLDTSSAAGRLVVNVLGAVSQWEREAAGERTSSAMRSMRERLLYTGGRVRYGYRVGDDGCLVPDEHEQAVLGAVRELHAAGLSLRGIGAELDRRGLVSRSGAPWGPSTVRRLVAA